MVTSLKAEAELPPTRMEAVILPARLETQASKAKEMEKVALSNNTCKCIDDMSDGIKAKLIQIIIKSNKLLCHIGESTRQKLPNSGTGRIPKEKRQEEYWFSVKKYQNKLPGMKY